MSSRRITAPSILKASESAGNEYVFGPSDVSMGTDPVTFARIASARLLACFRPVLLNVRLPLTISKVVSPLMGAPMPLKLNDMPPFNIVRRSSASHDTDAASRRARFVFDPFLEIRFVAAMARLPVRFAPTSTVRGCEGRA